MLFKGDTSATKQNVGEFVRDVSFSPYIREQNIHFHAYGLRPNYRHYVFFDQTNMDANTRPATVPSGTTISRDNFQPTGIAGASLVSSNTGEVFGIMQVPEEKFFVGERALLLADVDAFADVQDSSISIAEAAFNAYNFGTTKGDLTISTRSTKVSRPRTFNGMCSTTEKSTSQVEKVVGRTSYTLPPPSPPPQRRYSPPRWYCFIAGTKVIMDGHTEKNIEDVVIGDKVLRHDEGFNTVKGLQHVSLGTRKLCAVNGGKYFFTDDHPMMTDKGWAAVDAHAASMLHKEMGAVTTLQVGMTITGHGDTILIETLTTKEDDPNTPVYNFELDGNHEYFADGFLTHNRCFRAGTKVIIGDGSLKLIEDVEVGEELVGKDGMINNVVDLHRPLLGSHDNIIPSPLRMTSINSGGYDASEDHMFFTTDGWKTPNPEKCKIIHKKVLEQEGIEDIQALQIGDRIHSVPAGGTVEVESIEFKEDDSDLQLYNFVLTGNHTYHVVMEGHDEPMLVHNKACFMAGTEMTMEDHSKKKVEDVEVGDMLHGQSDKINKVEELLHPVTGGRKLVSINGGDYFCTEDHPFMTLDGGWKAANGEMAKERYPQLNVSQLGVGDTIEGHLKEKILVESIDTKEVPEDTPLYNFRLDGDHTYIAADMVMHNKCCWVARKVYGAYNPDWLIFRTWLLTEAPTWLYKTYLHHGEKFAKWLDGKNKLQSIIRKWMDKKIHYINNKEGDI